MKHHWTRQVTKVVGAGIGALFLGAQSAFAQGCVMCYTSASAAGQQGREALGRAILTLLIPPLAMFVGIVGYLHHRGR